MSAKSDYIWMDGALVPWDEANVHVLSHTLHYGTGVFEGIRCYKTQKGSAVLRHREHIKRLLDSAHIMGYEIPYALEEIMEAVRTTIRKNGLEECYIRPIVFLGSENRGLNPKGLSVHLAIAAWSWGTYLGEEALHKGIRVTVSSYTRHHPNIAMTKAKTSGNYVNSVLAKQEATRNGFDEAVLLDPYGFVAEGSGENIFIVENGRLKTPPISSILDGITRESVIDVAKDLGIDVLEQPISRDELYIADEAFFTGTAAELTPIREVDRRTIGAGEMGPITQKIQGIYFDAIRGKNPKYADWLDEI